MTAAATQSIWTDELAAESALWMRYLTFRPWLEDKHVIDLGASTRFGARYISTFAQTTELFSDHRDLDPAHPSDRFGFAPVDANEIAIANADVIFCFESLNSASDPTSVLTRLSACDGNVAVGYTPDGTWTYEGFCAAVQEAFGDRRIQFLSQTSEWPFRFVDGEVSQSLLWVATIGDESPMAWPSLGFSMPTVDSPNEVRDAILALTRTYPGHIHIAVVANGSTPETLDSLRETAAALPSHVTLLEKADNLGYGQGCNRGLEFLYERGGFEYFGVINDDVFPDIDCLGELVWGMKGLEDLGLRPGVVGPVSNNINGQQQVDIGAFSTYGELLQRAATYRSEHHASVTQVRQLRGLCLIIHPDLLESIGGFDPCFGIGNFEDDDHNLRTHLAGFTLWIAEGAFLFHHGSTTFKKLKVNYEANIQRNAETLARKWKIEHPDQWIVLNDTPRGVALHVPLGSWKQVSERIPVQINGEPVDLVHQASDLEFAAWVMNALKSRPRTERKQIIEMLENRAA